MEQRPVTLADCTDAQLLDELRRRLEEHARFPRPQHTTMHVDASAWQGPSPSEMEYGVERCQRG